MVKMNRRININFSSIRNKVEILLKSEKSRLIMGVLAGVIVLGLVIVVCFSNKNDVALRKNSWKEFIIDIDGNTIKMGEKISLLETMGFTTDDSNYKGELERKFTTGGIAFKYKDDTLEDGVIFFSAYNSSDGLKSVSECDLNGVEISQLFYKKYNVTLPGGILLTDNTTIKDITDVWGKYSDHIDYQYSWISDDDKIRIYTTKDGKIFSVVYDLKI